MRDGWFSARAIRIHLTALVVVPGCIALGFWQLNRALGGNDLSWAYVFEWPIFSGYAVFVWWRLLHEEPLVNRRPASGDRTVAADRPGATTSADAGESVGQTTPTAAGVPDDISAQDAEPEDVELAEYNRYLAALNADGRRKHW